MMALQFLLDEVTKLIFFGGAAGGGKSWLLCEWLMMLCESHNGIKCFIGREELKRLRMTTVITFKKVLAYHGRSMNWSENNQLNYLVCKSTGSRIDLLDLKLLPTDPLYERFGSLEYTVGAIDEAEEVNFAAWDVLKSRINRWLNRELGIKPKLLCTLNPTKNWPYRIVWKPYRDGSLEKGTAFIPSFWQDNPYLASDYGETLSSMRDKNQVARLRDGNWEFEEGPLDLMNYNAICDLFTNPVKDGEERFMTVDIARKGQDKTVFRVWYGFKVVETKRYEKQGINNLLEFGRDLCQRHQIPRSHVIADEDGVGGGFVDMFACKGFHNGSSCIQPEEAKWDKSKVLNYKYLRDQCWFMFADKVNKREIAVANDDEKGNQQTAEDLEQIKQQPLEKSQKLTIIPKDITKQALGRSPDDGDSLMMRMWFEIEQNQERDIEIEENPREQASALLRTKSPEIPNMVRAKDYKENRGMEALRNMLGGDDEA